MKEIKYQLFREIIVNISLLTFGAVIVAIGIKSIIIPKGFITGGASGLALLVYYFCDIIPVYVWYMLINIPVFLVAWFHLGKESFFYTMYGTIALSLSIQSINFVLPISNEILAVFLGGIIIGFGLGLIFSSKGSTGGCDIVGIILKKKFNIKIGTFYFIFNSILFGFSIFLIDVDTIFYSIASSFCTSQVMDNILVEYTQEKTKLQLDYVKR